MLSAPPPPTSQAENNLVCTVKVEVTGTSLAGFGPPDDSSPLDVRKFVRSQIDLISCFSYFTTFMRTIRRPTIRTQLEFGNPFELPFSSWPHCAPTSCLPSHPCTSMALTVRQRMFCRHNTRTGSRGTMSKRCMKKNGQFGRMRSYDGPEVIGRVMLEIWEVHIRRSIRTEKLGMTE